MTMAPGLTGVTKAEADAAWAALKNQYGDAITWTAAEFYNMALTGGLEAAKAGAMMAGGITGDVVGVTGEGGEVTPTEPTTEPTTDTGLEGAQPDFQVALEGYASIANPSISWDVFWDMYQANPYGAYVAASEPATTGGGEGGIGTTDEVGEFGDFGVGGEWDFSPEQSFPIEPTGQAPASTYYGWAGDPYGGWQRKLEAGGQTGYTPYTDWMKNQYQNAMSNWQMSQMVAGLTGKQLTPWYTSPTQLQTDPSLWGKLGGVAGTEQGQQFIGQNPEAVYSMALGALGGGQPLNPYTDWQGGQFNDLYRKWQAFDQPKAPGTTGTPWTSFISKYLGGI